MLRTRAAGASLSSEEVMRLPGRCPLAWLSDRVITLWGGEPNLPFTPQLIRVKEHQSQTPIKISPHLVKDLKTATWEESDFPSHGFARDRAEARIWNSGPYSFYNRRGVEGSS